MSALAPGSTIGILGGGQLGRMLALAAARLGFNAHIYTDEPDSPAARVAARHTSAAYDDAGKLAVFARSVDVVTSEFENVPAATAEALDAAGALVRPHPRALAIAQDRYVEKEYLRSIGLKTAPSARIDSPSDFSAAIDMVGLPAILKTRRLGYDGKGQARVRSAQELAPAFAATKDAPSILEALIPFEREVSAVGARGANGEIALYPICENVHRSGILARTIAPAAVPASVAAAAASGARALLEGLDYVGVLAIEYFVLPSGEILANEFAPRVHNSGHWTEDACLTGQFEQHIRAVAGWPLGAPVQWADCEMTNLIGADADNWARYAADPDARLHLYGKREARPGRKMGHVTKLKR